MNTSALSFSASAFSLHPPFKFQLHKHNLMLHYTIQSPLADVDTLDPVFIWYPKLQKSKLKSSASHPTLLKY